MTDTLKDVERQARSLTPAQRARLVELLLESLREAPLAEIEVEWDREIRARVEAYERGELKTFSAEDVFAEARRLARRAGRGSSPPHGLSSLPKSFTTTRPNQALDGVSRRQ